MNNYMIVDLATQQATIKPIGDYLFARQGDSRRPLPVWFQSNGKPFALDGYLIEWAQTNADGDVLVVSGVTTTGSAVGQVTFYFPANVFAVAGVVTGHFLVKKESDGTVISSIDLSFDVKKDNVLMHLDTAPFMNDWEKFKESIRLQTQGLNDQIVGLKETANTSDDAIKEIAKQITDNNIVKKSELESYVNKETLAGYVSKQDATLQEVNGSIKAKDLIAGKFSLAQVDKQLFTPRVIKSFAEINRSGFYAYDSADLFGTNTPPFLTSYQKKGTILASFIDTNNMYIRFLESDWEYYVRDGKWAHRMNKTGVNIYSGSASIGETLSFEGNYYDFDYCIWHIYYQNYNRFITVYPRDGHVMYISSSDKGNIFNHIFLNFVSSKKDSNYIDGLNIREAYNQLSTGSEPIKMNTFTLEIYGFNVNE